MIQRRNFKIGKRFNYEDKLSIAMRFSVAHNFCCTRRVCDNVGSTTQVLHNRIEQHQGRSFRTGAPLSHPAYSSIRDHVDKGEVSFDFGNYKTLFHVSRYFELRLLESLYIFITKPKLNDLHRSTKLMIVNI